jgi:hypothetical protein
MARLVRNNPKQFVWRFTLDNQPRIKPETEPQAGPRIKFITGDQEKMHIFRNKTRGFENRPRAFL